MLGYKILAIAIMALVTYIPRAIPIAFIHKKITNVWFRSFLYYVPYAVLAALTFPSIFYCLSAGGNTNGALYLALIGTVVAIALSYFKMPLYIVALASVAVVFGFSFIFY